MILRLLSISLTKPCAARGLLSRYRSVACSNSSRAAPRNSIRLATQPLVESLSNLLPRNRFHGARIKHLETAAHFLPPRSIDSCIRRWFQAFEQSTGYLGAFPSAQPECFAQNVPALFVIARLYPILAPALGRSNVDSSCGPVWRGPGQTPRQAPCSLRVYRATKPPATTPRAGTCQVGPTPQPRHAARAVTGPTVSCKSVLDVRSRRSSWASPKQSPRTTQAALLVPVVRHCGRFDHTGSRTVANPRSHSRVKRIGLGRH